MIFPEFLVRIKAIGKFCRITNQRRELRIAVFRWAGVGGPTKFCVGASVRAADFSTAATVCDNLVAVGMLELEPNPHPQVGGKAPALPLPVQAAAATRAGKTSAAAHGRTSGGRPPNPSAPHAGARFFRARGFLGPWDPVIRQPSIGPSRKMLPTTDEFGLARITLKRRPVGFATWRWHTIYYVTSYVHALVTCNIDRVWSAEPFRKLKDQVLLKIVDDAIKDVNFLGQVEFFNEFTGIFNDFLSWCKSCPCHDIMDRRKTKKLGCAARALRLPELRSKVADIVQGLLEMSDSIDPACSFFLDATAAPRHAAGQLVAKLQFLSELPYLLAYARDPAVAKAALKQYDATAKVVKHHRVTEEFLARGGLLRSQMEVWLLPSWAQSCGGHLFLSLRATWP